MKLRELFKEIRYVGEAEGDRNTYYTFEANKCYLVLAPNTKRGYYLNIVEREAPDAITKEFKGQRVTSTLLSSKARRRDLFPKPLIALNALYVTVALRRARKLKQRDGRSIVFKIR